MEKQKKLSTRIKHKRIQLAYRQLQKARLKHAFCLDILKEFFSFSEANSIVQILYKDIHIAEQEHDYEHYDLDAIWIAHRIEKHIDEHLPSQEQKQLTINYQD